MNDVCDSLVVTAIVPPSGITPFQWLDLAVRVFTAICAGTAAFFAYVGLMNWRRQPHWTSVLAAAQSLTDAVGDMHRAILETQTAVQSVSQDQYGKNLTLLKEHLDTFAKAMNRFRLLEGPMLVAEEIEFLTAVSNERMKLSEEMGKGLTDRAGHHLRTKGRVPTGLREAQDKFVGEVRAVLQSSREAFWPWERILGRLNRRRK